MRYYIMTLVSIVVVLTIKSYTTTAQDTPVNDVELEKFAHYDLINKADTLRHKKIISRFVHGIASDTCVTGKYLQQGVLPNPDFESYERLERTATNHELSELAKHDNPVMRVYAINAIASRDIELDTALLNDLIMDSTEVMIVDGFVTKQIVISDLAAGSLF